MTAVCALLLKLCHSINLEHRVLINCYSILVKKSRRMEKLSEIELHLNMNKEDWFFLSRSWKPLVPNLRQRKMAVYKENKRTSS
jgi:hypothetical protein